MPIPHPKTVLEELKRIQADEEIKCPFYGHSAVMLLGPGFRPELISTHGNQCALVLDAHSPCYMTLQGNVPDWKKCARVELARQQATLLEEHINMDFKVVGQAKPIVVAFFVEEWRRDLFRNLNELPLPAVVPNSEQLPCSECQALLWADPRSLERVRSGIPVMCPNCMLRFIGPNKPDILCLNNPDSKF